MYITKWRWEKRIEERKLLFLGTTKIPVSDVITWIFASAYSLIRIRMGNPVFVEYPQISLKLNRG
jgi:hypothetical protein